MRGFESFNKLKSNLRDSRQIYDITYHLYQQEKERLEKELKNNKNINPTLRTSIGSIEHSPTALSKRLESLYPYKLRQLILISSITALEVYLTDVIIEIFKRDITPFKIDEPITFQKNYLLSLGSVEKLQNDIIKKDFRNLTSGGLNQIEKYYRKLFNLDLKSLELSFHEIEEIHIRRHLFVHRNGVVDTEYINKYPEFGYKVSQQIKIEHDYLINSLDKITEFSSLINKVLLRKFPEINRQPKYYQGDVNYNFELKNIMLELVILNENFDHLNFLKDLNVRNKKLSNYIVQIITLDNSCLLFLTGKQSDLSPFYKPIIEHSNLRLIKTIELKDNSLNEN